MSILYKNVQNIGFVLFRKNSITFPSYYVRGKKRGNSSSMSMTRQFYVSTFFLARQRLVLRLFWAAAYSIARQKQTQQYYAALAVDQCFVTRDDYFPI